MPRAEQTGRLLKNELRRLAQRYPFIGDVRGKGLLLAFEIVSDRVTMEPFPAAMNLDQRLVEIAYEKGLIIYSRRPRDGIAREPFMVCPPMITTDEQVAEIVTLLDESLAVMAAELNLPAERFG
jgi:4-aminobutyrate aminotransferase-like enzyme